MLLPPFTVHKYKPKVKYDGMEGTSQLQKLVKEIWWMDPYFPLMLKWEEANSCHFSLENQSGRSLTQMNHWLQDEEHINNKNIEKHHLKWKIGRNIFHIESILVTVIHKKSKEVQACKIPIPKEK